MVSKNYNKYLNFELMSIRATVPIHLKIRSLSCVELGLSEILKG